MDPEIISNNYTFYGSYSARIKISAVFQVDVNVWLKALLSCSSSTNFWAAILR